MTGLFNFWAKEILLVHWSQLRQSLNDVACFQLLNGLHSALTAPCIEDVFSEIMQIHLMRRMTGCWAISDSPKQWTTVCVRASERNGIAVKWSVWLDTCQYHLSNYFLNSWVYLRERHLLQLSSWSSWFGQCICFHFPGKPFSFNFRYHPSADKAFTALQVFRHCWIFLSSFNVSTDVLEKPGTCRSFCTWHHTYSYTVFRGHHLW